MKSTVSVESRVFGIICEGVVSILACFLIVRVVLPPWISLYFFDICIHVIISCKNNDSVSWERKKRILSEGYVSNKRKSTAFDLPVSNLNTLAKNDFHQKFERLMILQYSILRYSAIYD